MTFSELGARLGAVWRTARGLFGAWAMQWQLTLCVYLLTALPGTATALTRRQVCIFQMRFLGFILYFFASWPIFIAVMTEILESVSGCVSVSTQPLIFHFFPHYFFFYHSLYRTEWHFQISGYFFYYQIQLYFPHSPFDGCFDYPVAQCVKCGGCSQKKFSDYSCTGTKSSQVSRRCGNWLVLDIMCVCVLTHTRFIRSNVQDYLDLSEGHTHF